MQTRRTFLKTTAASAGTLAFGVPSVRAFGANEKLNIGLIGSGNRGRSIITECVKNGHNIVAIADCAKFRQEAMVANLLKTKNPAKPETYDDYRKLLEHKGLDAVIIATPDHHHKDCLLAAMAAGKHAYCEKPLSHTIEEGKEMVEAVRNAKRIVQVGNQRHSGEHWARCRDVIQSADFGDLVWVKVWDCRNWVKRDPFAPPKTFDAKQIAGMNWEAFLGKAPKRDVRSDPLLVVAVVLGLRRRADDRHRCPPTRHRPVARRRRCAQERRRQRRQLSLQALGNAGRDPRRLGLWQVRGDLRGRVRQRLRWRRRDLLRHEETLHADAEGPPPAFAFTTRSTGRRRPKSPR